jgi:hypothetical protein
VGEPSVRRVLDEVVRRVCPDRSPLPTSWDGDFRTWNDLTGMLT